jgi:hypothetical protein
MEDDTEPDSDSERDTYAVEFTAAELYTLHGLLQYNSIDMEMENAQSARGLAKHIHETMASESFTKSMDDEMDEIMERMKNEGFQDNVMQEIGQSSGAFQ